jgi:nucleoid-associated protein YgaU
MEPQLPTQTSLPHNEDKKKELSDLEKLKISNDEYEKELVRSRTLREEKQKIEAERMLSSSAGNPIPTITAEQAAEAKAKSMADEIIKSFH